MYKRILYQMREMIRKRSFVMTLHAEEKMDADGLTIFDVERSFLTGTIIERQRDQTTAQNKCRLRGQTVSGEAVEVVAKFSPTRQLVIITVDVA